MGLKFTQVDTFDKLFEKFAKDPAKELEEVKAIKLEDEDKKARDEHLGIHEKTREEMKIIK